MWQIRIILIKVSLIEYVTVLSAMLSNIIKASSLVYVALGLTDK